MKTRNWRVLLVAVIVLVANAAKAQSANDEIVLTPHHAAESVGDIDRAVKWYQQMFHAKVIKREKQTAIREIAWVTFSNFRVDLIHVNGSTPKPNPQPADHMMLQGWGHIVFEVPNVDKAFAILKARGVVMTEPVATNEQLHIRTCHFQNSEGDWLEIYSDVPAK